MKQKSSKQIEEVKIICLICKETMEDLKESICHQCHKKKLKPQCEEIKNIILDETNKFEQFNETQFHHTFQKLQKGKRPPSQVINKKQPHRCEICKKKTGIYGFTCKHCNLNYCKFHRIPQQHFCQVDFIIEGRKKLKIQNPRIQSSKIQHI